MTILNLNISLFTGLLESQAFIGRKRVLSLYLNASQIESVSSQTFNGLTELEVLHLEDNLIHSLQGYEFSNLTSLRELYLEGNKLVYIDDLTFSALTSLEVLHLHDNLLNTYPVWQLKSLLPSLTTLTISGELFFSIFYFLDFWITVPAPLKAAVRLVADPFKFQAEKTFYVIYMW